MATVLVIESNTGELIAISKAAGHATSAAVYGEALQVFEPTLTIKVAVPYVNGFDASQCDGVVGVVFTGSSVTWSTDATQAAPLRAAMETVFATGLPTLGSCNGMLLAAVVLGGRVWGSPNGRELGLARDVRATASGRSHPMLSGRAARYNVPCVHRDEVQALPTRAVHLAENDHSPIQAFAYAADGVDFWGVQYHPELRPQHVAECFVAEGSLFRDAASQAADYLAAESDPAAAVRIGSTMEELAPLPRSLELRNWLRHVAERAAV